MSRLEVLVSAAAAALARHGAASAAAESEAVALEKYKRELLDAKAAQEILQIVAETVQQNAHEQIARVVSHCLSAVFPGRGYSFNIRFEKKRGKTDARMVFVKGGHEVNPVEADSGGVLQVAAFALRLACLMLATPKKRRVLFLDEPFSAVDGERVPLVGELLEALAKDLGVQIILVTHSEALQVGKVVKIGD